MDEQKARTVCRWFAGVLVFGTLAVGAVAPADASTHASAAPASHVLVPTDTGWGP